MLDAHKDMTIQVDRTNATLLDVFAYVYTGFDDDLGCGKDGDTHWSFGLFDENDKPIASFHDDCDYDIYDPTTGRTVKMHMAMVDIWIVNRCCVHDQPCCKIIRYRTFRSGI